MLEFSIIILAIALYLGLERVAKAIEFVGEVYDESNYNVRIEDTPINIKYEGIE